jgi:hypothetical protein
MDIKRVAFETRPVTVTAEPPVQSLPAQSPQPSQASRSDQAKIDSREREVINALVDKFVAARRQTPSSAETLNANLREPAAATNNQPQASPPVSPMPVDKSESNGHRPVDFVCEEDVRRAVAAGEKIYVDAKTIITPAARELGEQREVFTKTG